MCSRCVMDISAADIHFDEDGYCNYCSEFAKRAHSLVFDESGQRLARKDDFIQEIKKAGSRKKYDCVIGLSGGVDSSYALHLAVQEGLRPLAVHMDNNWNSELAVNNIKNLVDKLGVDLYTWVIDWAEYKQLMQSFFDADVIDVELLYDNAMLAVNYKMAIEYGVRYLLSGSNTASEGMSMPPGWNWFKWDKRNIKSLAKAQGVRIKTFPSVGVFDYVINRYIRQISWVSFLDYYEYNKEDALNTLEKIYAFKRYPYKHYESVFTRFYQGYLLPEKFDIDKRKLHLSSLIMSGQLERAAAVKLLQDSPYESVQLQEKDRKYFLKKMGWSDSDLTNYIDRSERPHSAYSSELPLWNFLVKLRENIFNR